ncbi:MAG: PAAR domain-containing protein [Bryobacteraceae bacterium]|jgi:uncharacterized Zn-binding protein involved in type VI secretion
MAKQSRLGDRSQVPKDSHSRPCCSHNCIGPAETGSPDVEVNGRAALRVTDTGVHSRCCGPNTWIATQGSATVLINNLEAHRLGDRDQHCGGPGNMVEGSDDVLVGG